MSWCPCCREVEVISRTYCFSCFDKNLACKDSHKYTTKNRIQFIDKFVSDESKSSLEFLQSKGLK